MKLSAFQRRGILAGALIATVAAALIPEPPDDVLPARRAQVARTVSNALEAREGAIALPARDKRGSHAAEPLPELATERLAQTGSREAVLDAFDVRSWVPPPQKPAPPPPPVAPSLPFTFIGKMIDGSAIVVFLARQDRNYAVREGDKLDGIYQVEEIKPGLVTLTYLPLGQKQTLAIGAVN